MVDLETQNPAGTWQRMSDKFYRRHKIYDMTWPNVELGTHALAAAPYGGQIALVKDPKKNLPGVEDHISIYTSSGSPIHRFLPGPGKIAGLGWTSKTHLAVILEDGNVVLYTVYGSKVGSFHLGEDIKNDRLVDVQMWGDGFVALTANVRFVGVFDVESIEPRIFTLANPNETQPPTSWTVFPPTSADPDQPPVVLLANEKGTIKEISLMNVTDQLLSNGPFTKMCISPSGKLLACFTTSGNLWVVLANFSKQLTECNTGTRNSPKQLTWCGNDSVLMYWDQLLMMVGPAGDQIKWPYDQPLSLVPECDGVRVFSNETCEFVHKVPDVTVQIFQIGSTAPAAMLYDALEHYMKNSPKADENVRSIKADLTNAVETCIEAAGNDFNPKIQRTLLKAAAFGKAFLDVYRPDKFLSMCKTLRVLNAIRVAEVGIPITYAQYQRLTPEGLVTRLMNLRKHLLAYHISKHLGLPVQRVLLGWACEKVQASPTDLPELSRDIYDKLKEYPGISYARIASVAYQSSKKSLATKLLDYEPRAAEQVPLLLRMAQEEVALAKAVESGDTDLVFLVLLHMIRTKQPRDFLEIVRQRPAALELLLSYCKQQNHDLLKKLYFHMDQPHLKAAVHIRDAHSEDKFEALLAGMQNALSLYQTSKDHMFHAKATEEQIRLFLTQRDLEIAIPKQSFFGSSVSDTILKLLSVGDHTRVRKIVKDFKIPEKTLWWLRLKSLSQEENKDERFAHLWNFAQEKKSPIGYEPFADVAIASCVAPVFEPALRYIQKIVDPVSRAEYYIRVGEWRFAGDTAFKAKNLDQLQSITARCNTPDKSYLESLVEKLEED
ncbi:vacuolar protein sorting-associated protein 16 [Pelomyxa schiedti]|nr:vacuolar protein sorting-associated protein 16 [Pelomyxa schiedti]